MIQRNRIRGRVSSCRVLTLALAVLAAAVAGRAEVQPLAEPAMPAQLGESHFSNDRTVALLGEFLTHPAVSADPSLRERAVSDLGRTMNRNALGPILSVLADTDEDWCVRVAAVQALGRLPLTWVAGDLKAAVADKDNRVAAAAVGAVMRQQPKRAGTAEAAEAIEALIDRGDDRLTALTLRALTHLGVAAHPVTLAAQLQSGSVAAVLEAIRNARLLAGRTGSVAGRIHRLAVDKATDGMLRGEALITLGVLLGGEGAAAMEAAVEAADWRVRAGAAEALRYVGVTAAARRLLADRSGPVRLAACGTVGGVRDGEAFENLWKMLADDPVEANRQAALAALVRIDHPGVATRAAQWLGEHGRRIVELNVPRRAVPGQARTLSGDEGVGRARRLAVAAGAILGRLKSHEGYDYLLSLLAWPADSVSRGVTESDPLAAQVIESLGLIADPRAADALSDYLDHAHRTAEEYYSTVNTPDGATVLFSETAYANALRALAAIDPAAAIEPMRRAADLRIGDQRMHRANIAVADVLAAHLEAFDPADADALLGQLLSDPRYPAVARWRAIHTVGARQFRRPRSLAGVHDVLTVERPSREFIRIAAWAQQELTGQRPQLPQPKVNDPPDMLIRDLGPAE